MLQIPLTSTPSQTCQVVLNDQNCQIAVYVKSEHLFFDLAINDVDIVNAVICKNVDFLVCRDYVGFIGNLFFIDTQGDNDPTYDQLGSRYKLVYLNEDEYDLVR
jgi:hypothetical protein